MAKKVTKSKKATAEEVVNVCGELPDEVAKIFHLYFDAFLKQGFTTEQSFLLTRQIAAFYLQ